MRTFGVSFFLCFFPQDTKNGANCEQGDQIGRIFALCEIVYHGQFFKIAAAAQFFGGFFHDKSYVLI
jgi:hypothetical protein